MVGGTGKPGDGASRGRAAIGGLKVLGRVPEGLSFRYGLSRLHLQFSLLLDKAGARHSDARF